MSDDFEHRADHPGYVTGRDFRRLLAGTIDATLAERAPDATNCAGCIAAEVIGKMPTADRATLLQVLVNERVVELTTGARPAEQLAFAEPPI